MPFGGIFGAADRNAQRRKAEGKAYEAAKEQWRKFEEQRENQYEFEKENYENQLAQQEENLRFQEAGLIQSYNTAKEIQDYEFSTARRAYDKSVSQAFNQKTYNQMAADAATRDQNVKLTEDLLGLVFDETQAFLDYKADSTGLNINKQKQLVDADFQEAGLTAKMTGDIGSLNLRRRQLRSESRLEAQKTILDGMKAAGRIRSLGTNGRSSAKSVLGTLAESGALQSIVANSLMYAEQGIDLDTAKIKDMFLLDQTMVLAARDRANNDFNFESARLDASRDLDLKKFKATKKSIIDRDDAVRRQIFNARMQADLNAEAAILLEPERMPEIKDPRELYAEYDNPETEDYVELFFRPDAVEFPEFISSREPERDDFKGERENVGLSNFTDVLKIGSFAAGGIGAFGGALGLGSMTAAGTGNFLGLGANTWSSIGTGLGSISGGYAR